MKRVFFGVLSLDSGIQTSISMCEHEIGNSLPRKSFKWGLMSRQDSLCKGAQDMSRDRY